MREMRCRKSSILDQLAIPVTEFISTLKQELL